MKETSDRHVRRIAPMRPALFAAVAALSFFPAHAEEPWTPKAWLGVTLGTPARSSAPLDTAEGVDPGPTGVLVTGVAKGSPADEAGLRAGDVIHAVNREPVDGAEQLIRAVGALDPGKWVEISLTRRGGERTLDARLDARPGNSARLDLKRGWAGLEPVDVPRQLQEHWGGEDGAGVLVGAVTPGSPADVAGLMPGDLVVELDGRPVTAVVELLRGIVGGGVGNKLEMIVSRQGTFFEAEVELVEQPPPDELEEAIDVERREWIRRRRSGR